MTAIFEKLFKFVGTISRTSSKIPPIKVPILTMVAIASASTKIRSTMSSSHLSSEASNITRPNLISLGTCIRKYNHRGNFHLTVQALNLLADNTKHNVWLKPQSEMSFLYGNNVLKSFRKDYGENCTW